MLKCNEQVLCYLTPTAREAFNELTIAHQMDPDLAIALLERLAGDEIFELPALEEVENRVS
jgi:hypothetical protein